MRRNEYMNVRTINLNKSISKNDTNPLKSIDKKHYEKIEILPLNNEPITIFKNVFQFNSNIKTPTDFFLQDSKDWWIPINKMITLSQNLNLSIVSYKSEHKGNPFVNIVKMDTRNKIHNKKSKKELRGHTDGLAHRMPNEIQFKNVSISPDFIILTCLRNNDTPTKILFLEDILTELTEKEKSILSKPIFIANPQLSYDSWLPALYPISVLNNNQTEIRFSHDKIDLIDPNNFEAKNCLKKLKNIVENKSINVNMNSGDIAFINNRNCLHGRGHPGLNIEDKDRWIIRSYGMRNKNIIDNNKELI